MKKLNNPFRKIGNPFRRLAVPFGKLSEKLPFLKKLSPRLDPDKKAKLKKIAIKLKPAGLILIILLAIAQVTFGVLIYGFKKEDKVTRAVAKVIPYPIAIVNYNVITYDEYLKEKDYIHFFYQQTSQNNVNLADIDQQILTQLVENKVLDYEAWRYHVKVTNDEINTNLNSIIDQNGGQDKVEKVLSDLYGLDLNSFRRLVQIQLLRDKINQDLVMKVTARHILIRVARDAPADKVDEAKKKIDGLLAEIKSGTDFAESAKKNSEDTGSSEQGGLLEPFARGEMVQEFSDAAFTTPVGSISDPVRTDYGWHIIKVESKTGKIDKSFTDWLDEAKKKSLVVALIK